MLLVLKEYRFCCKNDRAEFISNINIIDKVIEIMKSHSDQIHINEYISITKENLREKLNTAKDENATFEMLNCEILVFSLGKISYFNGRNFEYGKILLLMDMDSDKAISSFKLKFEFDVITFIVLDFFYDYYLKEYVKY